MVQIKTAASILALGASALAQNVIQVAVDSRYDPETVTAAQGDIIQFNFNSQHSVAQSDFGSPCTGQEGGIYSGPISEGGVFSVQVNSTDPIWIYCGVGRHCQGGQVMVINPPSSGDSLDAYRSAAGDAGNTQNPGSVQGGILAAADSFSSGGSASTSASSAVTTTDSSGSSTTLSTGTTSATATESSGSTSASASAAATSSGAASHNVAAGVAGFAGLFAAFLA